MTQFGSKVERTPCQQVGDRLGTSPDADKSTPWFFGLMVLIILGFAGYHTYDRYLTPQPPPRELLPAETPDLQKAEFEEVFRAVRLGQPTNFLGPVTSFSVWGHPEFPVTCTIGETVQCKDLKGDVVDQEHVAKNVSLLRNESILFANMLRCSEYLCVDRDTHRVAGRVSPPMRDWISRQCKGPPPYNRSTCQYPLMRD